MPVAPDQTTPTERRKPTRRSWRHLPASPPVADPLPTPDPDSLIASAVATDAGDGEGTETVAPAAHPAPRKRRKGLLIAEGDGGYHLERPQSKVDVTRTDACRRWHHRYQTPDFLQTCLTAQL